MATSSSDVGGTTEPLEIGFEPLLWARGVAGRLRRRSFEVE